MQRYVKLKVDGKTCNGCLKKLRYALKSNASVSGVEMSLDRKLVSAAVRGLYAAHLVEIVQYSGKDAVTVKEGKEVLAQHTHVDTVALAERKPSAHSKILVGTGVGKCSRGLRYGRR